MKNIVAGNWKMNLGPAASAELAQAIVGASTSLKNTAVYLAPCFTSLAAVCEVTNNTNVWCGAQNIHWEESGAFTGEVSAPLLTELGAKFALVGHSERRHVLGETNELVIKRGTAALKRGFPVVFCIGETLEEREAGRTFDVLREQLDPLLSDLSSEQLASLTIAYEPVWAIGTGKVASVDEISAAHEAIVTHCKEKHPSAPPVLYGGSVKPDNFGEILAIETVSGGLIGGASLSFESFQKLIEISEDTAVG